ncbi:MAG: MFS transporter [Mycobacterium sp.]
MALPPVLRHRDFSLYWFGVVFSQVGTRGTVAANLFQVYALSKSIPVTGLVGLAQAVALLVLSPLGGAYADRLHRRRLLQITQAVSLAVALGLTLVSYSGNVRTWQVLLAVVLTTAAATFDQPARQALIPAMVPRAELPQAFSLLNPSRELAVLLGPALAGVLIAVDGAALMYLVDAATYVALIAILSMLRIPLLIPETRTASVWANITEGVSFVVRRPLIWQLMTLDLAATVFGAYRVVLPALSINVLAVGATGYGLLSAAPSAGALLLTYVVFRVIGRSSHLGWIVLWASVGYGAAVVFLAQAPLFALALTAGILIGGFDAMATTIRHAAVQLETPDELRGRVSSIYQMFSRGGPALGDVNVGWIAGLLGPVTALSLGGLVSVAYAGIVMLKGTRVRAYRRAEPAEFDQAASVVPPPDTEEVPGNTSAGSRDSGREQEN